jgi:transposase
MQKPESGNSAETLICELLLPAGTLRLSGNITAEILQTLVRELEGIRKQ